MKTIGIIGGMSWESTKEYYRLLNEGAKKRLGKHHSAKILLYSFDFEDIMSSDWDVCFDLMIDAAQRLEKAGADFVVIAANTMHKCADEVERSISIPLLHIAHVTAENIKACGAKKVGLLGSKCTMEEEFYKKILSENHGIEVIIPGEKEREVVNDIIHDELCHGQIKQSSKERFIDVIQGLKNNGAEGVVLGCTEIPLLVTQEDVDIPLFDTTAIHAEAALEEALQ